MDFFFHGLIGLAVVVVWEALGLRELFLKVLHRVKRWRTWKRLFDVEGEIAVSTSQVQFDGDKKAVRAPDVMVEQRLRQKLGERVVITDQPLEVDNPRAHHLVIGSTRYSPQARLLQHEYSMPYEYVYDYFQADPPRRILKIVSAHGQEYISSVDTKLHRGSIGTDYGLLVVATLPKAKRVYWISGIHGAGTLGVAKRILENPDQFLDVQPTEPTWMRQWLFRVSYDVHAPESFDMITDVEVIRGPEPCVRRTPKPIRAVISDFGNVLMTFDRNRTYRALAHVLGRPYRSIAVTIESSGLRAEYERGAIDDKAFFEKIKTLLGGGTKLDFEAFAEWWGDIFWENRSVAEMFQGLKRDVSLVLLSNTNNLHFSSVREHYGDVLNLFQHHVLSFSEKAVKPAPALFFKAMTLSGENVRPHECVYIDDVPEYVDAARDLGMHGLIYHNYPTLVRDLRNLGFDIL